MKILFIVPYVPDLVRVRPYNLIRNLIAHGHQVTLATLYTNNDERAALQQFKQDCNQVLSQQASRPQTFLSCVAAIPSSKPLQAAYAWQPKLANQLISLINQSDSNFDIIHLEHLRGSRYGLVIKSAFDNNNKNIPIVWDSVDCISLLFRQARNKSQNSISRLITLFETNRTYKYERWLLGQFNRILVTSPVDKSAFESMRSKVNEYAEISVIPNGVDLDYFHPNRSEAREPATIVISGKMSYHANVTMVMHFVQDILPIVWSQYPRVKLWIVGKDPPQSIRNLAQNPAIIVTGTVKDIRPYLHKATLAVAPIVYGVGIQNKVLEAMACGTPVVATSKAVSALSIRAGRDAIIADDPDKFAKSIIDLLINPNEQRQIGEAGRRYIEENHDWNDITNKLEDVYDQVSGM